MGNHKILIAAALALAFGIPATAQNITDLIISEVMAVPDSALSVKDDYGQAEGWVEIFNKSQGTVNYGGCYITDDRSAIPAPGTTKNMPADSPIYRYLIPKGDLRTQLGPRQATIFYASGNSAMGTFYLDFKIKKGSWIYLVSNDKCTIIDSIQVPAGLPDGLSVKKSSKDVRGMVFTVDDDYTTPSPSTPNASTGGERITPSGGVLTLVSVSVVFLALAILWGLFNLLFQPKEKKKKAPKVSAKGAPSPEEAAAIALALSRSGSDDVAAAIALALNSYLNDSVHDSESFVITIKPSENSGWNDKTMTFRKLPRR